MDLILIQNIANDDRIAFKRHAVLRMQERGIRADDVRSVLRSCKQIT